MSIIFEWKESDIKSLLASCTKDETWPLIQKHFFPGTKILESGCGLGRWVRFLTDLKYQVTGLEYRAETVAMVHKAWPDLDIVQGDCEASPFPDNSFDGALSFGVVEHWPEGPEKPLADLFRILKPNGKAYISVPCHNTIRVWKKRLWFEEIVKAPRALAGKLLKGKKKPLSRLNRSNRYVVDPAWGDFFEYRMTPEEFRAQIEKAGFKVITHVPVGTMDGIYHELNPFKLLVKFEDWEFKPTKLARWMNEKLKNQIFMHPHMQAVIAEKPASQ